VDLGTGFAKLLYKNARSVIDMTTLFTPWNHFSIFHARNMSFRQSSRVHFTWIWGPNISVL